MTNNFYNPYRYNYNNIGYPKPSPVVQPSNNGILWVQGIEGAKAFQLAPNSSAILMDSDNDNTFYIKVSDNIGMCTLRTFNYTEVIEEHNADMSAYVTREELDKAITELKGALNEQSVSAVKRTKKSLIDG